MTETPPAGSPIEGQLNAEERRILMDAVSRGCGTTRPPRVVIEVGTWLGGGSTLHLLRSLAANGEGHLWGVEADQGIYEQMLANIRAAAPEAAARFTPLLGFSEHVIPRWLAEQPAGFAVDLAFLDGGNNPREQVTEFNLLAPRIPVGGQLFAHDAKLRKGKWLGPYLRRLDNWETTLHDVSAEGLLQSRKLAPDPSPASSRAARRLLWRLQMEPQELAATVLPRRVCGWILSHLPERFVRRVADGRR